MRASVCPFLLVPAYVCVVCLPACLCLRGVRAWLSVRRGCLCACPRVCLCACWPGYVRVSVRLCVCACPLVCVCASWPRYVRVSVRARLWASVRPGLAMCVFVYLMRACVSVGL